MGGAGGAATAVDVDLVVHELKSVLRFGDPGREVVAMGGQQGEAFLLVAAAVGHELGATADGLDGHPGRAQPGADGDPIKVELMESSAAASGAGDEAGALVIPRRVHAHAGAPWRFSGAEARRRGRWRWLGRLDVEHTRDPRVSGVSTTVEDESRTIALITGANKGLGYETARRLLETGYDVLLGARDHERGRLAADKLGATFIPLDVTDDASVAAAAEDVAQRFPWLDVLINNAGIVGPRQSLPEVSATDAEAAFDTNVLGVIRVTQAFLPLLRQARQPRIVNVSSGTGRISWQQQAGWPQEKAPPIYSASKAALTMLTLHYAHALPEIQINAAWPGYTATDLNDRQGTQTVAEGAAPIVSLATLPPGGPTGILLGINGPADPW